MRWSFLIILFILIGGTETTWAGVAVLRPHRSENALVVRGDLDQDLLAQLVLEETNQFRASKGRAPLVAYRPLMTAAQDHADAMAEGNFFAHKNPHDPNQRTLTDRIRRVGISPGAYAENIAMTFSRDFRAMIRWDKNGRKTNSPGTKEYTYRELAQSVAEQWINSRGHRTNMLGKIYSQIGLGFASVHDRAGYERIYCVQTFSASPASELAFRRW